MNAKPEEQRDQAFLARVSDIYNAIKVKRAEVIEAALSVEGLVNEVLLDLLVGRGGQRALVKETVLLAEFCTSFQKWKMLRRLMSDVPAYFDLLSAEAASNFRKDLKDVIGQRNKFAHGDLIVDVGNNYGVLLRYFEDGTKYLPVTGDVVEDVLSKALECRKTLWDLHSRFGTDIQTTVLV